MEVKLESEFDDAEAEFKKRNDGVDEEKIRIVEKKWM
jgi:hypothetical protein